MLTDQSFHRRQAILLGREFFLAEDGTLAFGRAFRLRESDAIRERWDMFYVALHDENPDVWTNLLAFSAPLERLSIAAASHATVRQVEQLFLAANYTHAKTFEERFRLKGRKACSGIDPDEFIASLELVAASSIPLHPSDLAKKN